MFSSSSHLTVLICQTSTTQNLRFFRFFRIFSFFLFFSRLTLVRRPWEWWRKSWAWQPKKRPRDCSKWCRIQWWAPKTWESWWRIRLSPGYGSCTWQPPIRVVPQAWRPWPPKPPVSYPSLQPILDFKSGSVSMISSNMDSSTTKASNRPPQNASS